MWFKKNTIKKKIEPVEKSALIPNLIWATVFLLIIIIWFVLINYTHIFDFKIDNVKSLNPKSSKNQEQTIIKEKEEQLKGKMNILIVWRWWGDHDAPDLTDTIILTSINSDSKTISMLSIPRDTYIQYPGTKKSFWKINWLYVKATHENKSKKIWMEKLKDKITEMTGEKIDYYANVDFEWFKKIIDTIWWVEIDVAENFIDDRYPDWNWWYKTLVFKKWVWTFDWDNALKYARSRHSTSDFDRSNRQQIVIKAIKDKLTWSYFLTSPLKVNALYKVFKEYVDTDITLSNILKISYTLKAKWDYKIVSSNLNNSCFYWSFSCEKWGFLYTPERSAFWWMSVQLVEWTDIKNLNDFEILNKFTDIVFNNPKVYTENYKINVFNGTKKSNTASKISDDLIRYWFNIPEKNSIWNADKIYENSIIYYNWISSNSDTIKALKKLFTWEFKKTDLPYFSTDSAKIEIVIWEDFKWEENPFKF